MSKENHSLDVDMWPLKRKLRDGLASVVTKRLPGLIYYLADRNSRAGLHIETRPGWIDIVDERAARKIRIGRHNAVYVLDMLNAFDYYHASAAPIRIPSRGKIYRVVDFSTPRFHEISGFPDFPVMCPSLTEPFLTTQQYIAFSRLSEGGVAIDLGSYSGLTSIAFSKVVGSSGKVIALEPDPLNFAAAQINIALHARINKLANIVLMNNAVASENGSMRFSSEGSMGSADISIVGGYRGDSIEVACLTLQEIAELHRLDRVDFVKVDIEGSEEQVLASSEKFFRRFKPRIIIESHVVGGILSEQKVSSILEAYGYRCATMGQGEGEGGLPLVTGIPGP